MRTDYNWAFYDEFDFSFTSTRSEVADIMDISQGMDILDVGCADGKTLKYIKDKHKVNLYGVEPDRRLSSMAGQHGKIFCGTVEKYLKTVNKSFDAIIMTDVIEHLVNPWVVVRELGRRLKEGGAIYASIPNVMHATVLYNLLVNGSFAYQSNDIVNREHLRFFTYNDAMALFIIAGLKPQCMGGISLPIPEGCLEEIEKVEELFGREDYNSNLYQFVIKAVR